MSEIETTPTAPDLFEKARSHDRREILEYARREDMLPYFRQVESEAGPVVRMEGRERLMLGSNNYLGLTGDPRVKQAARDALDRYGTALTGSRLMNGTIPLHHELEHEIAAWMRTEDAIVFTTGYQANLGCLSTILSASDTVIAGSSEHASILDGCKLSGARFRPYRHGRIDRMETMLERARDDGGGVLAVVDGVYSMEGGICDVASVAELCSSYGARLMVDEAHAAGVIGPRGAGAGELYGVEDRVDLRMGTFSKSLASCGGFIAGAGEVIEYLRIASRPFLFTAAAVPAATAAALEAVRICRSTEGPQLFAKVLDNARYLHAGFRQLGLRTVEPTRLPDGRELLSPIVPVIVGEDLPTAALWKALWDEGLYTNVALHPAVPKGGSLIRTSVMATHEREHLDRALEIFERAIKQSADLTESEDD
ncbi:MAG: aminotransferase class I/II-fold pyridoxal phosphate-dependent enzyme [Solirubrobacterales bacterium]